jgi:FMN phosphatase YigB (HAD superfamily)
MIDTILFDLDGTLLHFSQKAFIDSYFGELGKVFAKLGIDPGLAIKAVWAGTKAMLLNDGSRLNAERFWASFSEYLQIGEDRLKEIEAVCDGFYSKEFDRVKSVVIPNAAAQRLVRGLAKKGYTLVLATNPLFPACAVTTRLNWIGLEPGDFALITHYANSTFCKPNPGYYHEILGKTEKKPENCLIAGNNPVEDMCAGALGMETFLVTDCLENETNADISVFRRGTLEELEEYLSLWPVLL